MPGNLILEIWFLKHLRSQGPNAFVESHGKAHWSLKSAPGTECVSVNYSTLVEKTNYLFHNVYIKVGNNVHR